jgi:hypothetical protein
MNTALEVEATLRRSWSGAPGANQSAASEEHKHALLPKFLTGTVRDVGPGKCGAVRQCAIGKCGPGPLSY